VKSLLGYITFGANLQEMRQSYKGRADFQELL